MSKAIKAALLSAFLFPGTEAQLFNVAWTGFIISWLIGIVDSYRIGRKMGKGNVAGC